MRGRLTGLWRNADFVRLWAAQTISILGSLVGRTALPFVAILTLDATPFQIAVLGIAELIPGFGVGLVAGAWIDRLYRRPILIAADVGRALLLVTIPIAAVADVMTIEHLYLVAALTSVLTVFFDVAYQSYLPSLVRQEDLVEGNSKLSASASVAEFVAFSSAGWLVQLLTAPIAILVDSVSFIWSALMVRRIEAPEPPPAAAAERQRIRQEIVDGLRVVLHNPVLRAIAGANFTMNLSYRLIGTVFLLYLVRDLGFKPGALGLIFAIGGVSALGGALLAERTTRRLGIGPAMIAALVMTGIGAGLMPLASGVTVMAVVFLIGQQLIGDGAATIYEITQTTLRQTATPARLQGRMNASMRVIEVGAALLGALLGGVLGQTIGLRETLVVASIGIACSALWLLVAPIRTMRSAPAPVGPDVEPMTEAP